MAKKNKEIQADFKTRKKESGLLRKEYWATQEQHKKISAMLKGT